MNKIIKSIVSSMTLCTMIAYTMPIMAYTNEETIYSKLNTSGDVYETIASTIKDDESSQEKVEKDLPITCKVTYTLDDEEISAEELAGKSGKVKISLKYENSEKHGDVYTPFVVVTGMIIDNDVCKNIEISNGKIINNGNNTIAIGFSLPGMEESLNLSSDIEIPSIVEISMEATNFEMSNIISFATPKILEEGDLDKIYDKLDDIYSQINTLEDASNELEKGTVTLRDGMVTLNGGANDLNNGVQELKNGVQTLNAGTKTLNDGATALKDGSSKVNEGATSLNTGYAGLDKGIKDLQASAPVLKGGIDKLEAETKTVVDTLDYLNGSLSAVIGVPINYSVNGGNNVISAISEVRTAISNASQNAVAEDTQSADTVQAKADIQAQIQSLEATRDSLYVVNYPELQTAVDSINSSIATLNASLNSLDVQATARVDLTGSLAEIDNKLTNVENAVSAMSVAPVANPNDAMAQIIGGYAQVADGLRASLENDKTGIKALKLGTASLVDGVNSLSAGSDKIKAGIGDLANGTTALDAGVNELANGATSLSNGADVLLNGSNRLSGGANELASGTGTLLNGGNTLVEGVQKFNNEGIQKICKLVNVDMKNAENRIKKMESLSNEYQNFASDEERDSIKFITILDSIKVSNKDKDKNEIIIEPAKTDVKEND